MELAPVVDVDIHDPVHCIAEPSMIAAVVASDAVDPDWHSADSASVAQTAHAEPLVWIVDDLREGEEFLIWSYFHRHS